MDNRLNEYLQKLEAALGALGVEQRTGELREMRQHIEAMVARQIELGQSPDEALTEALEQFGPPQRVGRSLCAARAGESPGRVLTAVLGALTIYVWFSGMSSLLFGAAQGLLGWVAWLIPLVMAVLSSFGAGAFAGFIAPYRGKRSLVTVFAAVGFAGFLLLLWVGITSPLSIFFRLAWLASLAVQLILMWRGAIFGARYTQHRRLKRA